MQLLNSLTESNYFLARIRVSNVRAFSYSGRRSATRSLFELGRYLCEVREGH
jgi:hypothetical protein